MFAPATPPIPATSSANSERMWTLVYELICITILKILFFFLNRYAAGYLLEKSTFTPLDAYTQAGRQGRTGESCAQIYQQCNEL